MQLLVTQLSFTLISVQTIKLPKYPGSTFRGAFGHALKHLTCSAKDEECKNCNLNQMCAYAQLFNPHLTEEEKKETSSRFNNKPRPFVFAPETNEQEIFHPGQKINFKLKIFGSARRYLPYIIESWNHLENEGLGKGRGKFVISEIWNVNQLTGKAERIYSEYANVVHNSELEINSEDVTKLQENLPTDKLRLTFITPTLLKYNGSEVETVEFHILMRNLFRRLSALSTFYGSEKLDIDFGAYLDKAQEVELVKDRTSWQTWQRYSSRQQKRIKMKGLIGEVEYRGDLDDFLFYLILGQYIHIGKNTVFGLGNYKLIKERDLVGEK